MRDRDVLGFFADAIVVVHFLFVLFVVLGGLLVLRWRRVAWVHLPAAAWGAWIEFAGWICPLTPLENWLRARGGGEVYASTFVERYVVALLYPPGLTDGLQWTLGGFVILVNSGVYFLIWRLRRSEVIPGLPPVAAPRAEQLIAMLHLKPHPEGGHFREVFRSASLVTPGDGRPARAALTTIYYLLEAAQTSRWHRVQSDEIWHLYAGGPLELIVAPPDLSSVERRRLEDVKSGGQPVTVVPAHWWQAAQPLGTYALMGCTVAPGFEFADFEFLRDDPAATAALSQLPIDLQRLA